jgi:hypothetical protein
VVLKSECPAQRHERDRRNTGSRRVRDCRVPPIVERANVVGDPGPLERGPVGVAVPMWVDRPTGSGHEHHLNNPRWLRLREGERRDVRDALEAVQAAQGAVKRTKERDPFRYAKDRPGGEPNTLRA